jgi:hypothetical protein
VVGLTAADGEWGDAVGALLLFGTNVLAIVVVGAALFSAMRLRHGRRRDPAFRSRPVYAVVAVAGVLLVGALAATTYRTVQLNEWRDAATPVGSAWAREHGEQLVLTRFDGDTLVFVVERLTDGSQDAELPRLLAGHVPQGTPIVVNRIAGRRQAIGDVPG